MADLRLSSLKLALQKVDEKCKDFEASLRVKIRLLRQGKSLQSGEHSTSQYGTEKPPDVP